jgi:protein gp37
MGDRSTIHWTDATWNPVTGCSKVSPGCANCYAEALSLRRGWTTKPWTPENAAENVVLHPDRLGQPLRWRRPRRVFVNSMSDLFHELVPMNFLASIWEVMEQTPQHVYQILTKRADLMRRRAGEHDGMTFAFGVLPNVWLGVSVESQRWADERIPLLLETPAAVRFVSCEPLLGPLDLGGLLSRCLLHDGPGRACNHHQCSKARSLDWVIAGGESGSGHRPMELDWARGLRDQCIAARVPYFYKQNSGPRPGMQRELDARLWEEYPQERHA